MRHLPDTPVASTLIPGGAGVASRDRDDAIRVHLERRSAHYFGEDDNSPVRVTLASKEERAQSTLYRFLAEVGPRTHSVLVKSLPRVLEEKPRVAPAMETRPTMILPAEPAEKFRLEWMALKEIQVRFQGQNVMRFGTVNVLDYLPEFRAVVMESVADPPLTQLFAQATRLHPMPAELPAAISNVGAWLRHFDQMPGRQDVQTIRSTSADFVRSVEALAGYLAVPSGCADFLAELTDVVRCAALETLKDPLPLGRRHGDFAMRNILVGPGGRVTVIDTMARWHAPIYEDLGYFLNALHTPRPQVLSQGLAFSDVRLSHLENAFLKGYFGNQPIPWRSLYLFELQALLDKWAAHLETLDRVAEKSAALTARVHRYLKNRYYQRRASVLLQKCATADSVI